MKKIISIILCLIMLLSVFSVLFVNTNAASNGWQKKNGNWYYYENGSAKKNWCEIGSKWYYFNKSGVMVTGWQKINNKWYYFNSSGAMQTGWKKISKKWYFFNSSGVMQTGWKKLSGKWYYFNSSGAMLSGWQDIKSNRYYLGKDGAMVTGWQTIDLVKYYFDENGRLLRNGEFEIDGVKYSFDKDGIPAEITEPEEEEEPETPFYEFRNEDRLNEHFEKHGADTYCKTPEEYLQKANDVINNPNALFKTEAEDGDFVYYIEETDEIVFLSTDGYIRTYFICSGKDYFDRQ